MSHSEESPDLRDPQGDRRVVVTHGLRARSVPAAVGAAPRPRRALARGRSSFGGHAGRDRPNPRHRVRIGRRIDIACGVRAAFPAVSR